MLKGAYSHLHYFSKSILLLTLVFSLLLFSTLIGILVLVPFYGTQVITLLSNPDFSDVAVIQALKVFQIINMAGGLLLPALLYLWLCNPDEENNSGIFNSIPLVGTLAAILLILFAQPLIGWTNDLNSYLSLPEWLSPLENWMKDAEKQGALITDAFLSTTSFGGLMVNVFMIAILPAFAEELLFRGALAGLLKGWTKNIHWAVFISSFIFAAIHLQFYGFLPRFLLGMALGYLFFWSGCIWLPVVAHFTNNFLSVIVEFLFRTGYIKSNAENFGMNNNPSFILIILICTVGLLFYLRKKVSVKSEIR